MRLFWWLLRLRRHGRLLWHTLGREDPMTAVPVGTEPPRDAADLSEVELLSGMMRARAEAVEYVALNEPEWAAMRMDLVNLLLDEWASRRDAT